MGKGQGPDSGPGGRQALESPVCVPSLEYIDLMETTQYMNEGELRILADTYDSVYLHPVWITTVRAEGGGNPGVSHPHTHHILGRSSGVGRLLSPLRPLWLPTVSSELIYLCLPGLGLCPQAGGCGPGERDPEWHGHHQVGPTSICFLCI